MLHLSAKAGETEALRDIVYRYRRLLSVKSNSGYIALHAAAEQGKLEAAEILLSRYCAIVRSCNLLTRECMSCT